MRSIRSPSWLFALMLMCFGVARSIPGPGLHGAPPPGFADSSVAPGLRGRCCQGVHASPTNQEQCGGGGWLRLASSQHLSTAHVLRCLRGGSNFGSDIVLEGTKGGAAANAGAKGASVDSEASDEKVSCRPGLLFGGVWSLPLLHQPPPTS